MKIVHATDLHLRASRARESLEAVEAIRRIAEEQQADLIALSGDTWDGPIQNTAGSYFPMFVERIRALADVAPVVVIYGTPSHDTEGSLEVLEQVESKYGITILRPGVEYILNTHSGIRTVWEGREEHDGLIIYGVPEPSKKWLAKIADDKEAAEAGGRQVLRNLFLGLAAKRKELAGIPCLLLYHGEIAGASTSTGYESEENTNLVVKKEDIEAVGADYVAAGHIHDPQQIGTNIHYAGSTYSNWGEYHKPGVNLVTIDPAATVDDLFSDPLSVKRIDLPHPQRVKITREDVEHGVDYAGKLTWYEITCTQEEAGEIDTEAEKQKLIDGGALEGSRVTLNILPVETVRAEEIAEAQRLRDKLKVWAESSGDELSDGLLEKADELEEEAAREGQSGEGSHIRIDRLDLRGAIGVWKGTGLDTVSIDFNSYDPGLIALIGANGKGKTTLIENMHPWPSMLTREAKLQDHFRLRDSYRDLYFTDERSGEQYRALMQIDGQNKSGSVDYYLYRWDGEDWQPLSQINGRKDPYIEAIEKLYGSLQLYLRSAFISQRPTKGNPDLSDATKGERKALFRELAGLDYLQVHAERAKELAREKEAEINTSSGRLDALEDQIAQLPEIRERVQKGEKAVSDLDQQIADTEKAHQKATEDHQAAQKRLDEAQEVERRLEAVTGELTDLQQERDQLQRDRASYEQALGKRDSAKKAIKEYEELKNEREELSSQYQQHLEERNRLLDEWNQERDRISDQREKYHQAVEDHRAKKSECERQKSRLEARAEALEKDLASPISDTCPTCGQSWPAEKKQEWINQRSKQQEELDAVRQDIKDIGEEIASYQEAIETDSEYIKHLQDPPKPALPGWDNSRIEAIDGELAFYDISAERETLRLAEQAESKIESIDQRFDAVEKQIQSKTTERNELQKKRDPEAKHAESDARAALEKLQSERSELGEKRSAWNAKLEELREQVTDLEKKSQDVEKIRQTLQTARRQKGKWEYLQRACGPDGIQALELDALAPSIAAVANRLLQAAYDSRFRLEFRTTRIGGSGSKVKQMETFEVYIHDTEAGTEQELKTLSGGESVWIKKAIYDAFGIIRAQNTGTQFLTAVQDESDGALDPDAKEKYFRMLEAAHTESGRRNTIVITHSREIQEMISQRIEMDALVEAEEKEAVAV